MSTNNHNTFTAADIARYHRGEMSPAERHAIEKAALDDPFLAEALEGYASVEVDLDSDLRELRDRLGKEKAKVIPLPRGGASPGYHWLRIAAMILLLAGAGWLVYEFGFNNQRPEIAQADQQNTRKENISPVEEEIQPATDSSAPASPKESQSQQVEEEASKPSPAKNRVSESQQPTITTAPQSAQSPIVTTGDPATASKADEKAAMMEQDMAGERERLEAETNAKRAAAARKVSPPHGNAYYNNMNVFRGQVTDEQNNALPFVNITNTRDNVGTYTDAKGNFTLVSPDSVLDVQVRSLGYENTRTTLRNEVATNHVALQEDKSMTARVLDTVKRNLNRSRGNTMKLEEPEPADGWDYYDTYLVNNLNVPEVYEVKKRTTGGGEVELSFEVNKAGEPVNIIVEKSLCDPCDKEAIRLVKEGPRWKYKKKNGRTRVMVPFY